jgi:hypothetical protein
MSQFWTQSKTVAESSSIDRAQLSTSDPKTETEYITQYNTTRSNKTQHTELHKQQRTRYTQRIRRKKKKKKIKIKVKLSLYLNARGSLVVEALGYKPEGRRFETR